MNNILLLSILFFGAALAVDHAPDTVLKVLVGDGNITSATITYEDPDFPGLLLSTGTIHFTAKKVPKSNSDSLF